MGTELKFAFKCPRCGAEPNQHGKGGKDRCQDNLGSECQGVLCECDSRDVPESNEKLHGCVLSNPCKTANCYHCGWGGTLPQKPKGLEPWEKKALEAGWTPPPDREKELKKA